MADTVDTTQIAALIAEKTGIPWRNIGKSFETRKTFQKSIFLLQSDAFGIDLGFRFNLYLHGPYSPELAAIGYEIAEDVESTEKFIATHEFRQNVVSALDKFTAFAKAGVEQTGLRKESFLELAATILFVYRFCVPPGENPIDYAVRKARDLKNWFSPDACNAARDIMVEYGLLS